MHLGFLNDHLVFKKETNFDARFSVFNVFRDAKWFEHTSNLYIIG